MQRARHDNPGDAGERRRTAPGQFTRVTRRLSAKAQAAPIANPTKVSDREWPPISKRLTAIASASAARHRRRRDSAESRSTPRGKAIEP